MSKAAILAFFKEQKANMPNADGPLSDFIDLQISKEEAGLRAEELEEREMTLEVALELIAALKEELRCTEKVIGWMADTSKQLL
jgi:hypothetical protein